MGAVENCLQFSKSLVDAFFASTGTSASTPSSSVRKVSVSVETTENSRDDTRARTWVDLEVGRDPDRRSWGILTGFCLAAASGIFRVSLIASSDQTKQLAADQPRTDITNHRVPGASGYRTRRGTRTALAAPHRHCRIDRRSRSLLPFVRRRTPIAVRRVAATLVIKHFDVLEQLPLFASSRLSNRSRSSAFTDENNASITALS